MDTSKEYTRMCEKAEKIQKNMVGNWMDKGGKMIPKFKAWDKEKKEWFKPTYEADKGKLEYLLINMNGSLMLKSMNKITHESVFPDRFILVEYTGLKDCKGNEIYEGDIVTGICAIMGGSKENYGNFFIAWDNKEGRWELTSKEEKPSWKGCGTTTIPHFVISKAWTLEIIGNRFENPELLTKKG